jgi:hypothetical protein
MEDGLVDWQVELCTALGLDPDRTARIIIDVDPEWSLPMVYAEIHPSPEVIQILIARCFRDGKWELKTATSPESE